MLHVGSRVNQYTCIHPRSGYDQGDLVQKVKSQVPKFRNKRIIYAHSKAQIAENLNLNFGYCHEKTCLKALQTRNSMFIPRIHSVRSAYLLYIAFIVIKPGAENAKSNSTGNAEKVFLSRGGLKITYLRTKVGFKLFVLHKTHWTMETLGSDLDRTFMTPSLTPSGRVSGQTYYVINVSLLLLLMLPLFLMKHQGASRENLFWGFQPGKTKTSLCSH